MQYQIYRHREQELIEDEVIAETTFFADAQAVLKNWHMGYIKSNGQFIELKNMTLTEAEKSNG